MKLLPVKKKYLLLVLFVFLIFLILMSNIKSMYYHCFNANDFTIYQQPIYDIAFTDAWNPQMTVKDQKIFNDHFDPALILAAPFVRIFGASQYTLLVFEWLWFIALIIGAFWLLRRSRAIDGGLDERWIFIMALIVFSRSLLQGLEFPIHPTTWSMVPTFFLIYFIYKNKYWGIILSALVATQFRETIPFMVTSLSFYFLLKKDYKTFLSLFVIGVLTIINLLVFRPMLVGPSVQYSEDVIPLLKSEHIFFVWNRLVEFLPRMQMKIFFQYLIPVLFLIKLEISSFKEFIKHPIMAVILFMAPAIGIHILIAYFAHHHSVPIVAPLISLIVFSSVPSYLTYSKHKVLFLLTVVMLVGISSSRYTRMVSMFFFSKSSKCEISHEKHRSTLMFRSIVDKIPYDKTIIATGGVLSYLVRPKRPIYQFTACTKILPSYDYIVLEKGNTGDIIPLNVEEVDRIRRECRKFATKVLMQDNYYSIFEGKFTDDCLGMKVKWPERSIYVPPIE